MLCVHKHSKVTVTSHGKVLCLHCKEKISINKLIYVLVNAQMLTQKQMNDPDIWQKFDDNEDAAYIRDQLGKLHCIIEDLDL